MADLWELTALELAAAIRNGDASACDAVEACIDRIDAVNGKVNAVTVVYADEARAAAAGAAGRRATEGRSLDRPGRHGCRPAGCRRRAQSR